MRWIIIFGIVLIIIFGSVMAQDKAHMQITPPDMQRFMMELSGSIKI